MAQCLHAYREHLLGVSTLIPHCVRGDRSGLSMVPPRNARTLGTAQGALKNGGFFFFFFITPVIGRFMTFFLCGMSADTEGEAQAKLN